MISRLTATILSLCIALPMCWCCVSLSSQPAGAGSCCAMSQGQLPEGKAPQHKKDKNCPCAKHEAARDVSATVVKTPAVELRLVAEPVWPVEDSVASFQISFEPVVALHDHGPALSVVPVYTRHCALLL